DRRQPERHAGDAEARRALRVPGGVERPWRRWVLGRAADCRICDDCDGERTLIPAERTIDANSVRTELTRNSRSKGLAGEVLCAGFTLNSIRISSASAVAFGIRHSALTYALSDRHLRLQLPRMARHVLSREVPHGQDARLLCRALPHGRGQLHLLPDANRDTARRLGERHA